MNYVLVFIGGGLGACARYWLSGFVFRWVEPNFPYGVLIVNILGCLVIGFLMTGFEERFMINPSLRIFLTIGILGGFTTFSSFSYETISLIKDGEFFYASANIGASVILCLTASYFGSVLGKLI
jgi:CrcB protein